MGKVVLSRPDIKLASNRYSVNELLEIYSSKLEKPVRDYFREKLGVDTVYKCFDIQTGERKKKDMIMEMYVDSSADAISNSGLRPENIGTITTTNDNTETITPAPYVELIPRLGLRNSERGFVEGNNEVGKACSALSSGIRNSGRYFQEERGSSLLLFSSYYTSLFLPMFNMTKKVSMENKKDLNYFSYVLMFSDAVASVVAYNTNEEKKKPFLSVETSMMSSRNDMTDDGYKNRIAFMKTHSDRIVPDMHVNSKKLRNMTVRLSKENNTELKEKFPMEYSSSKVRALHTAGKVFLDDVSKESGFTDEEVKINYEVLRETGNTGPCSTLQVIDQVEKKGELSNGDYVHVTDFGWDGADSFIARMCKV